MSKRSHLSNSKVRNFNKLKMNWLLGIITIFITSVSKLPAQADSSENKISCTHFKKSNWKLNLEFFSGYSIFTQDLQKQFKVNIPFSCAFDIEHNNTTLFFRDYIGFSRTRDSISFPAGTWSKGKSALLFLPELSLGYKVDQIKFLILTPFLGISLSSITPWEDEDSLRTNYKDIRYSFTKCMTVGLNTDVKIGMLFSCPWSIRLRIRYGYNRLEFHRKYLRSNGDLHYLTVGIVLI
jgi:hypothetical protein